MDIHSVWIFIHVLLAVYWLGPDWGVYVASAYVCRSDVGPAERLRFMQSAISMAQVSRNSLILLLPVGLTLADSLGMSAVTGPWLVVAWALGLAWFGVSVGMYRIQGTDLGRRLNRIDQGARYVLIAGLGLAALASLAVQTPFAEAWLALKVMLYAFLLVNSIQQRVVAQTWLQAIKAMQIEGPTPALEAKIQGIYPRSRVNAYLTWAASFAIAFLGVTKII